MQHVLPEAPQQRPSELHRALAHWNAAFAGVQRGTHADDVASLISSQTVPASPHDVPGVLQSLRHTVCDWKVSHTSGAAQFVLVHASLQ